MLLQLPLTTFIIIVIVIITLLIVIGVTSPTSWSLCDLLWFSSPNLRSIALQGPSPYSRPLPNLLLLDVLKKWERSVKFVLGYFSLQLPEALLTNWISYQLVRLAVPGGAAWIQIGTHALFSAKTGRNEQCVQNQNSSGSKGIISELSLVPVTVPSLNTWGKIKKNKFFFKEEEKKAGKIILLLQAAGRLKCDTKEAWKKALVQLTKATAWGPPPPIFYRTPLSAWWFMSTAQLSIQIFCTFL